MWHHPMPAASCCLLQVVELLPAEDILQLLYLSLLAEAIHHPNERILTDLAVQ